MKLKTFIILLIICICSPLIVVKSNSLYKENKLKKMDIYSNYIIQLKSNNQILNKNNISISELSKDNIPLSIDIFNCNNKPEKFKLFILVNFKPVKFIVNGNNCTSIDFTLKTNPKITINAGISSDNFLYRENKLMVMILKQEDANRYNDETSAWCNVIDNNKKDYSITEFNKYFFTNINSEFEGIVLNSDFNINNNYTNYDYNKKIISMKTTKNCFKVALRAADLKSNDKNLIFFTYGDKLAKVNGNDSILMSSKENSSGFVTLNVDIGDKCKGSYLVCHMIKNPYEADKIMEIVSSNKICIN